RHLDSDLPRPADRAGRARPGRDRAALARHAPAGRGRAARGRCVVTAARALRGLVSSYTPELKKSERLTVLLDLPLLSTARRLDVKRPTWRKRGISIQLRACVPHGTGVTENRRA